MKSEMNSNHEVLSYRIKIKTWFQVSEISRCQVSGGGLWPGEISGFDMTRRILTPDTRNLTPEPVLRKSAIPGDKI